MISPKYDLIRQDLKSWAKVAALFLAPVALIYFAFVQGNIGLDGFAWSDFVPNLFVQGAMVAWVLNEALALIKKWIESNKY